MLTVNEPPPPPQAITYALAEGATGVFFDTDLLLANPNAVAAPVTITWLLEGGGTISESRVLAPTSRTTIKVDEVAGLGEHDFLDAGGLDGRSAIAVERTMRWGAGGYGAHTEKASDAGASTWYFAEGAAGWFSTYLLLGNPQATANTANVEWLREGEPVVTRSYELLPHSRKTIDTHAIRNLRDRAFGAKVTFDQPGVAERTMYFGDAPLWSGGGAAAGQTSLSTRWDFAEGATGTYFATFLLLANPGTTAAAVTITYFPAGRHSGEDRRHARSGAAHDAEHRHGRPVAGATRRWRFASSRRSRSSPSGRSIGARRCGSSRTTASASPRRAPAGRSRKDAWVVTMGRRPTSCCRTPARPRASRR